MTYHIERMVNKEWKAVRPTRGAPYSFETKAEADKVLGLFYDADPHMVRIIKTYRKGLAYVAP